MIALSRWTPASGRIKAFSQFEKPDGTYYPTSSADTWIFKSPLPIFKSDFRLGVSNCDTQVADAARKAGLRVVNPCLSIKTWHLHFSGFRNEERADSYAYADSGGMTPFTKIETF